jgi:hypothetical protein
MSPSQSKAERERRRIKNDSSNGSHGREEKVEKDTRQAMTTKGPLQETRVWVRCGVAGR